MFLSAVWTFILTALIHCRGPIGEQVVHPESIHSASLFPHFVMLQPYFQNGLNSLFSSKFYKQYPILTTWNKFVWNLCKFIKNKKRERKITCTEFTAFAMTLKIKLRCILFPLIILEMILQLDWSPPVVNSVDWTWFGKAHTCLYKVPQLAVHVSAQTKPWSPRNCLYTSKTGLYRGTDLGKGTVKFLQYWRFTEACSLCYP